MAATITLTIENKDGVDIDPAIQWGVDPQASIKLLIPEDKDWTTDRAIVQYYDNQRASLVDLITTETAAAIRALATTYFTTTVFINTLDGYAMQKMGYLPLQDFNVYQPVSAEPTLLRANFGEVNHADHKDITYCVYPFVITSVDISSTNSVTVSCCVADTIVAESSISIVGDETHTYTVVSSSCSTDGTSTNIIVEEPLDSSTDIGDTVALT